MEETIKTKGGRPKAEIDLDLVRGLAGIGCTQEEIAELAGCSRKTLNNREDCKEAIAQGMGGFKESLRRLQFKKAEAGSVAMLIWLGKQHLGQKDIVRQETTGKDGGPVEQKHFMDTPETELDREIAILQERLGYKNN